MGVSIPSGCVPTPPGWVYPYLVGVCSRLLGGLITPLALFPPPLSKTVYKSWSLVVISPRISSEQQGTLFAVMPNSGCIDLEEVSGVDGMSHCQNPSAAVAGGQHNKRMRKVTGLTTNASAIPGMGLDLEYAGLNRYVYTVKYHEGRVKMCVDCLSDSGSGVDVVQGGSMSVKDRKLLRSVVCSDLDQPGYPETVYVSQLVSATGPELYRVVGDCFFHQLDNFVFISVCEDRERLIAARGREEWKNQPYPLNLEEHDLWFKNIFFIQWCDWRALQRMFREVDEAIKRDRIINSYESIRKRLVFDNISPGIQSGLLPAHHSHHLLITRHWFGHLLAHLHHPPNKRLLSQQLLHLILIRCLLGRFHHLLRLCFSRLLYLLVLLH